MHTRESLSALSDRELDAVVAELVFSETVPEGYVRKGREWVKHCESHEYPESRTIYSWMVNWPPKYSTEWGGFGLVVERMLSFGFKPDVRPLVAELVDFGWARIITQDGRNRWSCSEQFTPRTAAIAAVLACEGVE